jgi:invasion protein IalB
MDSPMKTSHALAFIAALALSAPAFAQTGTSGTTAGTPSAASTPAMSAPAGTMGKARTAKSIECSKQADTKKLHGKERKKFMTECKKA